MDEIICAGFGGQGVLTAGLILINAGKDNGKKVCWYPSYGSEMRGGTANCSVKISDREIATPYAKKLNILFTLNEPSIDKFESMVIPNGYMFINSTLVNSKREFRSDINVISVPATEIAEKVGNSKATNIVMLGAVMKITKLFEKSFFEKALCSFFEKKGKGKYNDKNIEAFVAGYNAV